MPPLKGIDRGLTGEVLKALEESGHGRRLAVVDASYNIPRWAQTVDYRGQTSAEALAGVLALVPVDEESITIMVCDPSDENKNSTEAEGIFKDVVVKAGYNKNYSLAERGYDQLAEEAAMIESEGGATIEEFTASIKPFYDLANNPDEDTLFIRTPDTLPYACATFVIGHSQTGE